MVHVAVCPVFDLFTTRERWPTFDAVNLVHFARGMFHALGYCVARMKS
jgi:hypothetical protein